MKQYQITIKDCSTFEMTSNKSIEEICDDIYAETGEFVDTIEEIA